ncbi:hypothetical protein [Cytobacillus firmus]|uniref:hypothetical protein n=1 Tax=Cytobacillus firmus TaxID=1399 RepID=UPI0018CF6FF7|nr:hypothetical protein [Cytobacillus firmus]MBG9444820.1 hypothetical protein [Cytobacillus firmus]MBY6052000.1 hypothetical protein [Cytobacillus firmus]
MCGIDFVIAVTDKEAAKADKYVHFDEEVHRFLFKQFGNDRTFDLLLHLNRYETGIIYTKDIPKLIKVCENLSHLYGSEDSDKQEIRYFVENLRNMCEEALKLKKHLYTIGD